MRYYSAEQLSPVPSLFQRLTSQYGKRVASDILLCANALLQPCEPSAACWAAHYRLWEKGLQVWIDPNGWRVEKVKPWSGCWEDKSQALPAIP